MDNSTRQNYLAKTRDAISRILPDKVHQLAFLIEKTSFENSEGNHDAYINYIQDSIRTLERYKEEYIGGVCGQQGVNNSNQLQMPETLRGAFPSQPLIGHQQQQIQKLNLPSIPSMPNLPSVPSMPNQQLQVQPPKYLNQHLMGDYNSQPFVGNQQQHIQQTNSHRRPLMGRQQQPNNPSQPLIAHQLEIQQAKIPSQPLMGHQQQWIQPPNIPSQPLMVPRQQQIQHPNMATQPLMGQHQQRISSHLQQIQRPKFYNQLFLDPQQQKIQPPNMPIQHLMGQHQQENPRHQQQGQLQSNPSLDIPTSQFSQYQGHPTFNLPLPPYNIQPQNPYQQQNAFPYHHQYRFPPPQQYQFCPNSQVQQSQNPQSTQPQRQQVFQNPYQHQLPNHPHLYNTSHLQQNQFSLDSQQLQHKPSLKQQEQNQVKKDSGLPAPQPDLVPQFSDQRSQQSSNTSNQNVPNNELAKNSMVGQSNNQESKQILLNTPNRDVPLIEIDMKEDLNNAKLDQTQSSTSNVAQDAAKRELKKTESSTSSLVQGALEKELGAIEHDMKESHNEELERAPAIFPFTASSNAKEVAKSEECSNRDVRSVQLDMKQAHNEELERAPAILQFTASSNAKEVAKSEECSNRYVGSIQLDMKQAHNEELERAPSIFQFTASRYAKEIAKSEKCSNRDVGSIQLDMKEAHNEELERAAAIFQFTASSYAKEVANQEGDSTKHTEKAPSYPDWLSELVNDADAGLDYDVEADASAWLDFRAPQFEENATGNSIERLVNQIKSMEPNTFRDAVKEMASVLREDDFKVPGEHFTEQERWYRRFANAPEESNCTNKESTQLELVQEDIITIRNKIIDISAKISEDEEEKHNAFMNINPESVTEEDTKNGIFVKLSYLAISLDKDYKREYNSQPKMQIKPLRVLIPPNYPQRSPIILERYPESSQITEEFSAKAIAKFLESASCVEEPITLPKVAEIWNKSTREVVVSYAVKRGGGTFTSQYRGWTYCDK